jgi:UDP-glucose 4-epimerase
LGYIGSDVSGTLLDLGIQVKGIDNLSSGIIERGKSQDFLIADLLDEDTLINYLETEQFTGIVHLAAKKSIGDSESNPEDYVRTNTYATNRLFKLASEYGILKFIFASTAAVYSNEPGTELVPFDESSKLDPISVYGQTKLESEKYILENSIKFGISSVIFRFFNVAGSTEYTGWDAYGENLIPKAFESIWNGSSFSVYGNDYETPDGTCIRDFVHVRDITSAIVATIDSSLLDTPGIKIYNVGTGTGNSVLNVISEIEMVSASKLKCEVVKRRIGDIPYAVASAKRLEIELNWRSSFNLLDMLTDSWKSFEDHKNANKDD